MGTFGRGGKTTEGIIFIRVGVLRDLARKGSKQADVVVIAYSGHPMEEEEIEGIRRWKKGYPNKTIYLYNSIINKLKEF